MHRGYGLFAGEIVENDVPACFKCPAVVTGSRYPNNIPFCVLGIAKEATRFSVWVEFGWIIGNDPCRALSAEGPEV